MDAVSTKIIYDKILNTHIKTKDLAGRIPNSKHCMGAISFLILCHRNYICTYKSIFEKRREKKYQQQQQKQQYKMYHAHTMNQPTIESVVKALFKSRCTMGNGCTYKTQSQICVYYPVAPYNDAYSNGLAHISNLRET